MAKPAKWNSRTPANQCGSARVRPLRPRRLSVGIESLESRWAFAADALAEVGSQGAQAAALDDALLSASATGVVAQAQAPAPDLVQFAKNLAAAGVKFYGAGWCPHCTAQKQLFEDGQTYLPFIEVTNPNHSQNAIGIQNNIAEYPTWVFPNGSRLTGEQTLAKLSEQSGVAIPNGTAPLIKEIADTTLLVGSPLMVSIDGYDPNGQELTYTVTSDNPNVTPTLINGRSIRMSVQGFGDMVFKLFEDQAPLAAQRMIQLANSSHYNNVIFHRIINDFMAQGGGNSPLGNFDDQFNVDLQHNREGLLSMAKSTDDTNSSQFFITDTATRHLDFNHTVFGVLTEGDSNRQNMMTVPVVRQSTSNAEVSKPSPFEVRFATSNAATIFQDKENAVVMLKAAPNAAGSANITVTATDADGQQFVRTFRVNLAQDTVNGAPFLNAVQPIRTTIDTPVSVQLTGQDVEGNALQFLDLARMRQFFVAESNPSLFNTTLNYSVNQQTGVLTVNPTGGAVGTFNILVGVTSGTLAQGGTVFADSDVQVVQVTIAPPPPAALQPTANVNTVSGQNYSNASTLSIRVPNVRTGAVVELFRDGEKVQEAAESGGAAVFNINMSGTAERSYRFTARQVQSGAASDASTSFDLVVDRTAPSIASLPPTQVLAGQAVQYDVGTTEDAGGLIRYELLSTPLQNISINAVTGLLNWSPALADFGPKSFQVRAVDPAGNGQLQTVSLRVEALRWTNPIEPRDVNNDGQATLSDAQAIVEEINVKGSGALGARTSLPTTGPVAYFDVDQNGRLSPIDVLQILDQLPAQASAPSQSAPALAADSHGDWYELAASPTIDGDILTALAWANVFASQTNRDLWE